MIETGAHLLNRESVRAYTCMCVCVCIQDEREKEKERMKEIKIDRLSFSEASSGQRGGF